MAHTVVDVEEIRRACALATLGHSGEGARAVEVGLADGMDSAALTRLFVAFGAVIAEAFDVADERIGLGRPDVLMALRAATVSLSGITGDVLRASADALSMPLENLVTVIALRFESSEHP
jgi:hypothetical protein